MIQWQVGQAVGFALNVGLGSLLSALGDHAIYAMSFKLWICRIDNFHNGIAFDLGN